MGIALLISNSLIDTVFPLKAGKEPLITVFTPLLPLSEHPAIVMITNIMKELIVILFERIAIFCRIYINLDKNTTLIRSKSRKTGRVLNRLIFIGILILISTIVTAQKILVLENNHSLKNFKYYQGDDIMIKTALFEKKINDQILDMTDSTVIFNVAGELRFEGILCIYRENWLIEIIRGLSLLGGVAYFGLDSFNRLINNDAPVILTETLVISAGMVAFAFALTPLKYKKINTNGKWQLRTIDLNSF